MAVHVLSYTSGVVLLFPSRAQLLAPRRSGSAAYDDAIQGIVMRKVVLAAALALGTASMAVPASAQQSGLINVTVEDIDILRNSLNNNEVEILNNLLNNNQIAVPVSVQVPIGIAANVCNTTVALLSAAGSAGTCKAEQASRAFGQQWVKQQRKAN
jgi:hypothetical protein